MESVVAFFNYTKTFFTVIHVLTVVFGMGAAMVADVLFSFYGKDKKLVSTEISTLHILSTLVKYSLVFVVLSGIALFLSDMSTYSVSDKFLAKMTILLVIIVNGFFLNTFVWDKLKKRSFFTSTHEKATRRIAFSLGAVSVVSWVFVCALGVLDSVPFGYPIILSVYGACLFCALAVSLLIEKVELD